MMLKVMMPRKWFNLSDPMAEGVLRDRGGRISFRRPRKFVGIGLGDEVIDETSLVRFRARLRRHNLTATLFDLVAAHLKEAGLIVNEGTLVDATIIEAPRGRTREDGVTHTKDPGATFTKKHGLTYHGYKAHIAADGNGPPGVITDYRFDTAATHDSKHADDLMANEPDGGSVFADNASMDKDRKAALEKRGVFCGIIERRVRGQILATIKLREPSNAARARAVSLGRVSRRELSASRPKSGDPVNSPVAIEPPMATVS